MISRKKAAFKLPLMKMQEPTFCGCHFCCSPHPRKTMPFRRYFCAIHIFIALSLMIRGCHGQFRCNQPGHNEVIKWREEAQNLTLPWRLDQVCSGTLQCYGFRPETGDVSQDVQLCPAQMQYGDALYILPPPANSPYTTTVVNVSESEFYSCPSKLYPSDQILQNSDSSRWLRIPERFLQPGVLYLAQHPDGAFSNCNFGLRVRILIKPMHCRASPIGTICSGRGECASKLFEESYRCYCFENYRGAYCDEYDACAMDPCKNGANCVDGDKGLIGSDFLCICTEGFTGADCSEIVGQCSAGICGNGSCIATNAVAFKCHCRQGFSGLYCQYFTDMCSPNPCQNHASCHSNFQSYTCRCPPGYTGIHCEINIDECASNPCASGATCIDDVNGFYCRCPPGFDSGLCLEPIDFCRSNPCESGDCIPVLNGYYCNCSLGFHGFRCQYVISQCSRAPGVCQNGGHCLQSPGGPIQCQCSPGWTGSICDRLDNLCRFNPCTNGTLCIDTSTLLRPGTYLCACPPGYAGPSCQTEIEECSSNPCRNGGVCVDQLASYVCLCPEGYTGSNCETNIDMCDGRANLLCQNNGTCLDGDIGFLYTCNCLQGFTSADCSVNIQECESSPCQNSGTCVDGINTYTCICPQPFYGHDCASFFDYCTLNPCGRGATCIPSVGTYQCVCPPGSTGVNCTTDVNECASNPCRNGSPCVNLVNAFRCDCPIGYTGRQCEVNINDCVPGACLNGATCIDRLNGYRCACKQGYAGDDCGREILECLSAPCQNGGICSEQINGYKCFCDTELWAGSNCEIPLNNCSYSPCRNGATCKAITRTQFECNCPARYTGSLCESYMELCLSRPCLNGGTCSENLEDNEYDCLCPFGYFGKVCQNNRDFCVGHDCKNGATCVDGTREYTCTCPLGFRGRFCEIDIDDCASTPCKNGALCQDKVNGYQCFCVNGYVGTLCTEDFNECISSPCLNGAQCLNGRDRFVCECGVGYTGVRCEINIDECEDNKCLNDARCIDGIGGYTCQCRPGFVGTDCSFEINECLSSPCNAEGTFLCSDGRATYTCVCKAGYGGRQCEINIDECSSGPCQNDATCVDLVNEYRCICPQGITGRLCENNIEVCASNPCGVGTCVESVNGFSCTCPDDGTLYDRNCFPLQPCISRPCFNKGRCINLPNNQYRCDCRHGYEGVNCETINACAFNNITCQNGGLCVKENDDYTCVCTAGFSGRFCQINNNECDRNFCRNGATCVDGVNSYTCRCLTGFVGTFCETLATSCSEEPCYNGATCIQTPNIAQGTLFTCVCPSGFEGAYCHIETDECASDPCQNGGTCSQTFSFFTCECKAGYTGRTCEIDIDECVNNGCRNGATCIDGINGYECRCPVGISGVFCETEINDCNPSPCLNGGRCVDLQEGYQCFCRNGFTGLTCAVDYDECVSDPCQNNAECVNLLAAFRCKCPPGIIGTLCETNLDECSSSPCRNGASCIDGFNEYTCRCLPGFTGRLCETDFDECASGPCTNGGTCRDRQNMYVCDCPQPYRGVNCALLPCDLNPCELGGTCYNELSRLPDGFRCDCIEGLTGIRCQTNIDDCRRVDGTLPCQGRGLCLDGLNKYTCQCQPGWKGQDCEVPIDECTNNNCRNGATCINLWTGYRCQCVPGFEGQFCERETDECRIDPCTNGATCVDLPNDFRCICKVGWSGKSCDSEINECTQNTNNPCRNGGTCVDAFASFTCQCPPFYTGRLCEISFDPCELSFNQCVNGATCLTIADGTYRCRCGPGFTGTNCEIDIDECSSSPCFNDGQCEDRTAGYFCYCRRGFTGSKCETNIDDCLSCENGATCQDLIDGYICTCADGYRGMNCTEDIDECAVGSPCFNGGTCSNIPGSYLCICKAGYTGFNCETDIDECLSRPCQNKGICLQGFGSFNCVCQRGYTGTLCETNIDDCLPHPCGNGNCTDLVNDYTCTCFPGWGGGRCDINLDECFSRPCFNGAVCRDGINKYTCDCRNGFTGPRCEMDVDVCQNQDFSQCRNGGTCVDGAGSNFSCSCKSGYTGRFCETAVNECLSQPCRNGATCRDGFNLYTCICSPGWFGLQCTIDIDECESAPCINGGLCQQREPGFGYECLCRSGLGGTNCEINYDDCLPEPMCLNGGTCIDGLSNFTCSCPPYATGKVCETLLFTPPTTLIPSTTTSSASISTKSPSSSTAAPSSTGLVVDTYLTSNVIDVSLLSGTSSVTIQVEDSSISFVSIKSTLLSTFSSFGPNPTVTPTSSVESEVQGSSSAFLLGTNEDFFKSMSTNIFPGSIGVEDNLGTNILSSPVTYSVYSTSMHDTQDVSSMLNVPTPTLSMVSEVLEASPFVTSDIETNSFVYTNSLSQEPLTDTIQRDSVLFESDFISSSEEFVIYPSIQIESLKLSSVPPSETFIFDEFEPSVSEIENILSTTASGLDVSPSMDVPELSSNTGLVTPTEITFESSSVVDENLPDFPASEKIMSSSLELITSSDIKTTDSFMQVSNSMMLGSEGPDSVTPTVPVSLDFSPEIPSIASTEFAFTTGVIAGSVTGQPGTLHTSISFSEFASDSIQKDEMSATSLASRTTSFASSKVFESESDEPLHSIISAPPTPQYSIFSTPDITSLPASQPVVLSSALSLQPSVSQTSVPQFSRLESVPDFGLTPSVDISSGLTEFLPSSMNVLMTSGFTEITSDTSFGSMDLLPSVSVYSEIEPTGSLETSPFLSTETSGKVSSERAFLESTPSFSGLPDITTTLDTSRLMEVGTDSNIINPTELSSVSFEVTATLDSTSLRTALAASVSLAGTQMIESTDSLESFSATFVFEPLSPSQSIAEMLSQSTSEMPDEIPPTLMSVQMSEDVPLGTDIDIQTSPTLSIHALTTETHGFIDESPTAITDTILASVETIETTEFELIHSDTVFSDIFTEETAIATSISVMPDATLSPTDTIKLASSIDFNVQSDQTITATPSVFLDDSTTEIMKVQPTVELSSSLPEAIASENAALSSDDLMESLSLRPASQTVSITTPPSLSKESLPESTLEVDGSLSSLKIDSRSRGILDSMLPGQLSSTEEILPTPTVTETITLTSTIEDSNDTESSILSIPARTSTSFPLPPARLTSIFSEDLFPSTTGSPFDSLSTTERPALIPSDSNIFTPQIPGTIQLTDALSETASIYLSSSDSGVFDTLITSDAYPLTSSLADPGVLVTDSVVPTEVEAAQTSSLSASASPTPRTVSIATTPTSGPASSSLSIEISTLNPSGSTTTEMNSVQPPVSSTSNPTSNPDPRNCFDAPCLNGGTCETTIESNQLSYVCHCTEAFTGRRCEIPIAFIPMEFVGSSLLTFRPITLESVNIFQLTFQTTQEDGVIFYSAKDYSVSEATHYIRLLVKGGILRYQFSCVLQNYDLNSNVKVDTGQVFNVIVRQTMDCKARLEVGGPIPPTSVELGMPFVFSTLRLTTLSSFYVGGKPSDVQYVPPAAPNFVGCIRSFFINSQRYSLQEAVRRLDVGTCGSTLPTLPPITGSISPPSTTTTTRSATTLSTATDSASSTPVPPTCEDIICLNGGTCRNMETSIGATRYQCDCPLHYVGTHCEQEKGISFPEFLGNSYLQHPNLDFSERKSNDLYLSFKTRSQDGSLLYSHGPGNDFIHLFIADGYLRYQASCGPTNVLFVDTRVRVNRDTLVSVSVRQIQEEDGDCTVTVTINNDLETAVTLTLTPSQGSLVYELGSLYLGGLPTGVFPLGRASPFVNYVGCIRHLQINGEERLVYQDAIAGRNIRECNVPPCQYQPCYNNATCLPSMDGYTCMCLPSYRGVLCERTACDRNPCFHGGTCIHSPDTQDYSCLCPYGRHGVNCQEELVISRPQFYGMQLGYMSFLAYPQISALDLTFDFRFSFTLEEGASRSNVLLIFAGQRAAQSNRGDDYFAVGIIDDYLHFQFNLGSGKADIRTTSPIDSSQEVHRVQFGRNRQRGYLTLDNQGNVTGASQGLLMGLNVFSDIYVGGYDNFNIDLPTEISFREGFLGCLFDLEVRTGTNGQWKKPGSPPGQPETGRNIGQCQQSECQISNCQNGGTCVDLGATFRCECGAGWKGVTCTDRLTPCDKQNDCSPGSTCIPLASGGYTCHCPLGKAGDLCNKEIRITDARFVGEKSYMGFQHKGSLRFAVDIHLQFKSDVRTGLLLYMAEFLSRRSGDFLSVSLLDASVQLRYQVGVDGTTVVTSTKKINVNSGTWHRLAVGRNTTHGFVDLDGGVTMVKVPNQMVGLDVTSPIFIGGVPDLEAISSSAVQNEPSTFEGCIREFIVNKKRYEVSEKGATSGVNVVDCDGDECGYDVCKNGGTCFNTPTTGFVCGCTSAYTGMNCEMSKSCKNNDCSSGSTCVPVNTNASYRCDCPLGKQGTKCNQDLNFTSARFTGESYIRYYDVGYNTSDFTTTYISLNFSTPVPNGLIVWNGQAYSDKDDYLGVGVQNGRLRVVISLGWWTREDLISEEAVSDGRWHALIIYRDGRQLTVYVDGKRYNVNLAGQFSGLNTDGAYYFGGFEQGKRLFDETCGHFPAPLIGCLKDVYIHMDTRPIQLSQAQAGANILSCDNR